MFTRELDSTRQMLRAMSVQLGVLVIFQILIACLPPWHVWIWWLTGALVVVEIGLLVWWPLRGRAADERRPPDGLGRRTQADLRRYRRIVANMPIYLFPVLIGLENQSLNHEVKPFWVVALAFYLLSFGGSVGMLIYRSRHPLPDIPGAVLPAPVRSDRSRRLLAWMLFVSAVVLGASLAAWGQVGGTAAAAWVQIVLGTAGLMAAFVLTLGLLVLAAGEPPEGLTVAESQARTVPLAFAAITVPMSGPMLWLGWTIAAHSRRNAAAGWVLLVVGGLTLLAGIVLAIVGIVRARRRRPIR